MPTKITIDEMASFCKKKGFVYQDSEIYGSLAGFWDFGPLGVEMKNNVKASWWKRFVQDREDVVGMDGSIITHRKIWEASGHVDSFTDVYVKCESCKKPNKLDKNEVGKVKCSCGGKYDIIGDMNLMFKTHVGPVQDSANVAYLRPETAQLIFADFKLIQESSRLKLPFGIGQVGKAFRNEISPREFLFRSREFEQMEIEFFVHPKKINDCPFIKEYEKMKLQILTKETQEKGKDQHKEITVKELTKMTNQWHAYWLADFLQWFIDMGIDPKNLRIREHLKKELAHYAGACFDIEYNFPFGWKEIHGNADRTNFDLTQHIKVSKKDISIFDEESKERVVPYVASEPSQGVDRAFLALLFDAYNHDPKNKERNWVVLKLDPKIAPVKVGIFPLVNKIGDKAKELFNLLKKDFVCQYDKSGAIGRRYARADENGIPYCVTVDFDTLKDKSVTIRDRDSAKQVRISIDNLKDTLNKLINRDIEFEKAGKLI
jgi:glycyl-tRNA synthetase